MVNFIAKMPIRFSVKSKKIKKKSKGSKKANGQLNGQNVTTNENATVTSDHVIDGNLSRFVYIALFYISDNVIYI